MLKPVLMLSVVSVRAFCRMQCSVAYRLDTEVYFVCGGDYYKVRLCNYCCLYLLQTEKRISTGIWFPMYLHAFDFSNIRV